MAKIPAIFQQTDNSLNEIEQNTQKASEFFDLGSGVQGDQPFYSTGARALIRVGGKPLGVAQRCKWMISFNATPIHTVDSPHAWDVDVGQCRVMAELSQIVDPTKGAEADGLFHKMKSAVHQPMVEMQILDRQLGTQYFFARGMFTQLSGSVGTQELSQWQARFTGVAYQHYVAQNFRPYDGVGGATSTLIDGLQNVASDLTGGIL